MKDIAIIVVIVPANIAKSIVLNEAFKNFEEKIFSISTDQLIISIKGITNPTKIGIKQNNDARIFFIPPSASNSITSLESLISEYWAFALWCLSIIKNKKITKSKIDASCIAVAKSYMPNHVLKIPVVKVGIAKCWTAPKSESVSIPTIAKLAKIAGLIRGNIIRVKLLSLLVPRTLAESNIGLEMLISATFIMRYTYG